MGTASCFVLFAATDYKPYPSILLSYRLKHFRSGCKSLDGPAHISSQVDHHGRPHKLMKLVIISPDHKTGEFKSFSSMAWIVD